MQEVTDVFAKTKKWLAEHHLGWIVAALAAVAGFVVGRRASAPAAADFAKLRADCAELAERLRRREEEIDQLRRLHNSDSERYQSIAAELAAARSALDGIGKSVESGQDNVGKLAENNQRLREWIRQYGARLEAVQPEG